MPPAASLSSTRQGPSLAPIRGSTNSSSAIWCVGSLPPAESVFQLFPERRRRGETAQRSVFRVIVAVIIGTAGHPEVPTACEIEEPEMFRGRPVAMKHLDGPDPGGIEDSFDHRFVVQEARVGERGYAAVVEDQPGRVGRGQLVGGDV